MMAEPRAAMDSRWMPVCRVAIAGILLALGLAFIDRLNGPIWPDAFFDARVFGRAIEGIRSGFGPYALIHGGNPQLTDLPLVQPPHVAILLEVLAGTGVTAGAIDLVISITVALGIVTGVLASSRLFIDPTPSGAVLGAGIFASLICGAGMIAVVTGNLSGLLFGSIIASILIGSTRSDWRLFHGLVLVAVLLKPFFAALWIIPVMASAWSWRAFRTGAVLTVLALVIYGAGAALRPDLASGWLAALGSRQAVGDVGGGLYGLLYKSDATGPVGAIAVHAGYVVGLLLLLRFGTASGRMKLAALLITAIAANPRMNAYDYSYAAIPIFHIISTRAAQVIPTWGIWMVLASSPAIAAGTMHLFLTSRGRTDVALVALMGGAVILATQFPSRLTAGLRTPWRLRRHRLETLR